MTARDAFRAELVAQARGWLRLHAPYDPAIVDRLTRSEVCRDVARYHPGGWDAFEGGFSDLAPNPTVVRLP